MIRYKKREALKKGKKGEGVCNFPLYPDAAKAGTMFKNLMAMSQTPKKKKVAIIGAGPGGLSSAMLLAHKGYEVDVYEAKDRIGGRNATLTGNGYTFEIGPTFVMLPDVFRDTFRDAGRDLSAYIDMKPLPLMYELHYADDRKLDVFFDKEKLKAEIDRLFPGESKGYEKYLKENKIKYERLYKCLTVPYMRFWNYLRLKLLKAFPVMDIPKSVHDVLSRYFRAEDLKIAMSFQAKYLGMSPWECPGAFTILSYVEHAFGIYHPVGGVHKISEAMAKAAQEDGARIHLNSKVKRIITKGKRIEGIELESGETVLADHVIMNADFAYGISTLLDEKERGRYTDKYLETRKYSCSTFMIYLGVSKKYDLPHHNIFFSGDYKKNVTQIFEGKGIPEDPSFYLQNASVTDPSLAPEGKSTLYILVPVSNTLKAKVDWAAEKQALRDQIVSKLKERTGFADIEDHIEFERIITPDDWHGTMNVYHGAVFNLAHSLDQMLYLRPHNRFPKYENLYIVGGGTHPGSGLPTIIESGRIASALIDSKDR